MRLTLFCTLLIVFAGTNTIFAQGKLMLIGGGSEDDGGWSDQPYTWFVENASNKKIGIISYNDSDEWLPNYFKKLGALSADNIKINSRELAQSDQIFDSLIQYDALFFKGGDQLKYYNYYKSTPVQQAIEHIYETGGVIGGTSAGMAILSGVIFTAQEGSAYPIDALEDVNSSYITIADDFLDFYPNYIFDTHFIERGRTPRLIGFMANWFDKSQNLINGLGVDDRTAFCINASGEGMVFGTGAISIYQASFFDIENSHLKNSDVKAVQLTHGQSYDLLNDSVIEVNLTNSSLPELSNTYYQVFGTAEMNLAENKALLDWALNYKKIAGDVLIINTGQASLASAYQAYFESIQEEPVHNISLDVESNHPDSTSIRNIIRSSALLIVLSDEGISEYLRGGQTGELLQKHFRRNKMTSVFIGRIIDQLGPIYCTNLYSDPFNAYKNRLQFEEGLNLLPDTYIISRSFELDEKDYYENKSSSAVDAVLKNDLSRGLLLTGDAYFGFFINDKDELLMSTSGSMSSVVLINNKTNYRQTEQLTSSGQPRLQYAFDSLTYKLMKDTPILIGKMSAIDEEEYVFEEETILSVFTETSKEYIRLIQNPVQDKISFKFLRPIELHAEIYAHNGQLLVEKDVNESHPYIPIGEIPDGMYQVVLKSIDNQQFYLFRFLKRK